MSNLNKSGRLPGRSRSTGTEGSRTLLKGLQLLEVLAASRDLSLSELARRAGMDASTAYRMLESLRMQGFAERDDQRGLWRGGLKAYQGGGAHLGQGGPAALAIPEMENPGDRVQENGKLTVLGGTEEGYVQQAEGGDLGRGNIRAGSRAPLYCSGVGKVLMAWKKPSQIAKLLSSQSFKPYTPLTLTDPESLQVELTRIRRQGYALDNEEREPGVRCVAAPVRDWRGEVVAALSLSAPASRLSLDEVPEVARQVSVSADVISKRLGWTPEAVAKVIL